MVQVGEEAWAAVCSALRSWRVDYEDNNLYGRPTDSTILKLREACEAVGITALPPDLGEGASDMAGGDFRIYDRRPIN